MAIFFQAGYFSLLYQIQGPSSEPLDRGVLFLVIAFCSHPSWLIDFGGRIDVWKELWRLPNEIKISTLVLFEKLGPD